MIEALPIFPPASLDSSVTTTVWIGVLVVAFFNLRFGWIFSGLVVPGYLVPLILAKPISAVVIVGEAIVVYLLVWVLSERLPRGSTWSSFFGRDRFFLLIPWYDPIYERDHANKLFGEHDPLSLNEVFHP